MLNFFDRVKKEYKMNNKKRNKKGERVKTRQKHKQKIRTIDQFRNESRTKQARKIPAYSRACFASDK